MDFTEKFEHPTENVFRFLCCFYFGPFCFGLWKNV